MTDQIQKEASEEKQSTETQQPKSQDITPRDESQEQQHSQQEPKPETSPQSTKPLETQSTQQPLNQTTNTSLASDTSAPKAQGGGVDSSGASNSPQPQKPTETQQTPQKPTETQQAQNTPVPQKPTATQIASESRQQFKRNVAFKLRIGSILSAQQIMDADRLAHVTSSLLPDKTIIRANVIANITDKYIQEGEKQFGSITLDDATGQIKAKVFGDDIKLFQEFSQGDTVLCIGLLRTWNNELYLTPEILKKKDPQFLLIRKLEAEKMEPKTLDTDTKNDLKNQVIELIKKAEENEGIDIDQIIMKTNQSPEHINQEIKLLLEDGQIYEPRPGRLRYLG
jgi:RPA family protein